jgi:two-component system OmpR family response regulator
VTERRLLIVEDDEAIRKLEAAILTDAGYVFDTVTTGEDALVALRRTRYAAVLLDVGLPDTDGFQLADRIRRDPALGSPYVIYLTAKADVQSVHTGFTTGGVFYLTKPFTRAKLLDVVKAVAEMG